MKSKTPLNEIKEFLEAVYQPFGPSSNHPGLKPRSHSSSSSSSMISAQWSSNSSQNQNQNQKRESIETLKRDRQNVQTTISTDTSIQHRSTFNPSRPSLITLTFAQSLDGKIAGVEGQQLRLSGNQSLKMTHLLRIRHDGILVGIGTVINDDPQLTARNLSFSVPLQDQPQPIVLDSSLRTPIDCKLITNYRNGLGKQPWLICSRSLMTIKDRNILEGAGARVIPIINSLNPSKEGLDLEKVFEACKLNGIDRLMIEGGSRVISSCLNQTRRHNTNPSLNSIVTTPTLSSCPNSSELDPLIDILIVTVSAYLVGEGTLIQTQHTDSLSLFRHTQTKLFGSDAIFAYTTLSPISTPNLTPHSIQN